MTTPKPEVVTLTAHEWLDKFYNAVEWSMDADDRPDLHIIDLYVAEDNQVYRSPKLHEMESDDYLWFMQTGAAIMRGKQLGPSEETVVNVTSKAFVKILQRLIAENALAGTYYEADSGRVKITKVTHNGEIIYRSPQIHKMPNREYQDFRAKLDKTMPATDRSRNYYW